ncbi:putative F-box domain-containing protein [Rosa chinensis]|uniref:Putative F-box domain-containing protein n=1 Tax=Rosa chinensis TaxID=74649 RepID=A0A2P6RP21_ROSCH|nr:F-box/kelch-repeat protein At3g23880 [Rosa chinensis]PRQ48182.1 putative F-box domain-containing protein [Rosa chinensis]
MAETEDLPEEIIVNIFTWLPLKSLIRFTSVSKRLRSVILSDPKFAQSQLKAARQQKTLSRRLLVSTSAPRLELDSLDLDTPSFGEPSSVRKLSFPFPPRPGGYVTLLGSCNGLVFVAVDDKLFYIWNPFIGFLKQLPDPGFPLDEHWLAYYGVGYLSATDDYKVLVASYRIRDWEIEVEMFSSRTHIWQRIESPRLRITPELDLLGTPSNDALHWLKYEDDEIVSFDLQEEVFRRMPLPNFEHDGKTFGKLGVCGGCLCVSRYPDGAFDSIDFWVMREYAVSGSWIMLFTLKPPELPLYSREFLVVESCTVAADWTGEGFKLMRIDHKEDKKLGRYVVKGLRICMVEYEDSLLWISGCHSGIRDRAGQDTRNPSEGLRKLKWK